MEHGDAAEGGPARRPVMWDVIDELFERLDASIAAFLRGHAHPLTTLPEMARGLEKRLLAQLDGLLVAGPEVVQELPARLADPLVPERPTTAAALALALVTNGLDEAAARLLSHGDRSVRLAAARGCSLAASERFDAAAATFFAQSTTPEEKGAWLEVLALRDRQPSIPAALLTSAETDVVAGALRCLRGPVPTLIPPVERLAEHPEALVREPALRVALAWGRRRAWALCEAQALDSNLLSPLAMTAYAILGGPTHRARLAKTADSRRRVPHVLRALGFSGSLDVVPGLLERLGAKDGLEAKVAAQALVAITGLDLRNDVFAAPKASERPDSLPPLEEDDLEADLVPPPEDALAPPNVSAIRKWWNSQEGGLRTSGRLVLGKPRTPETLFDALERGPLGLRVGWATVLHLWSGGRFVLDREAFSGAQRSHLARGRAALPQWKGRTLGIE